MIPCSGEEYYHKIDNLLLGSLPTLRDLVRSRWREKTGKEWVEDKAQGVEFRQICGHIYKKSQKIQKDMITSGCLEQWDLPMLFNVLNDFKDSAKVKSENDAVHSMTKVRNDLEHSADKKLTVDEYNDKLVILRRNFLAIGLTECEIEKAVERAGVTSSVQALESVKKLYEKAENHEREGDFESAVECYTDAISMPSLLPVNQGVAFENRASCYLKMLKEERQSGATLSETDHNSLQQKAMLDSKQALNENERSWTAHYLMAQCHKLDKNLIDAIHHYQRALAISPVQKHIKIDLDVCKVLSPSQESPDHLKSDPTPMNLSEKIAQLDDETPDFGATFTKEEFLVEINTAGKLYKGQDHVLRGHQYSNGWHNVNQDYNEAARHFSSGARTGNPEGIYCLGRLYLRGKGVEQDLPRAFQYFEQAAEMDADTPGPPTSTGKNFGVAAAQHSLGLLYENGIHVEQNYVKAVEWYSKAVENGARHSPHNLALLYYFGKGVEKNETMAEMCWNQGVYYKDVKAIVALMKHCARHFEPDKALYLFKLGQDLGHSALVNMTEEDLNSMLDSIGTET